MQFLPDVDIPCPDCRGSRYGREAYAIQMAIEGDVELSANAEMERNAAHETETASDMTLRRDGSWSPSQLRVTVLPGKGRPRSPPTEAHHVILSRRSESKDLTPAISKACTLYRLSGGEAQRLKLASEMRRSQDDTLFIFDEPTIGLHPLDVETLIGVLQKLLEHGATVVVIEHDLDMIANADYVIDMGPGGGETGGRIVAEGTPAQVAANQMSLTGRYLARELEG